MATYSTLNDAIHREIITPLGEWADHFNIDAIAERFIYWHHDVNTDGTINLNRSGFRVRTDTDFWQLAQDHALARG